MTDELKTITLPNGVLLEMIKVEGGTFMMGSNDFEGEKPIHKVTVSDFYVSKHPITNEQFLPFLLAKGNQEEVGGLWVNTEGQFRGVKCGIIQRDRYFHLLPGAEKKPMIYVSWYGARAYAKWLAEECDLPFRLPSEAEWEFAAKGGENVSAQDERLQYAGTNKLKEVGWYTLNSHGETKPRGLKLPNNLGLYDMSGNVREWCADYWHDNYNGAPNDGSAWTTGRDADFRVVRGGSWNNDGFDARVSYRLRRYSNSRYNVIGFRLARS